MIQQQTILKVSDNSGAKTVKCIKVLGGFKRSFAYVGDVITVSVQQLRNRFKFTSKVQKGEIYKALIIKTKNKTKKKDGSCISFNVNSVSLINKQGNPVGTRIIGPVPKKITQKKFVKFVNISSGII